MHQLSFFSIIHSAHFLDSWHTVVTAPHRSCHVRLRVCPVPVLSGPSPAVRFRVIRLRWPWERWIWVSGVSPPLVDGDASPCHAWGAGYPAVSGPGRELSVVYVAQSVSSFHAMTRCALSRASCYGKMVSRKRKLVVEMRNLLCYFHLLLGKILLRILSSLYVCCRTLVLLAFAERRTNIISRDQQKQCRHLSIQRTTPLAFRYGDEPSLSGCRMKRYLF